MPLAFGLLALITFAAIGSRKLDQPEPKPQPQPPQGAQGGAQQLAGVQYADALTIARARAAMARGVVDPLGAGQVPVGDGSGGFVS